LDAAEESGVGFQFRVDLPAEWIGAYARIDSRLGWRPGEKWELSIGGQNLASPNHTEFLDTFYINSTQIPRSVFARLTIHF